MGQSSKVGRLLGRIGRAGAMAAGDVSAVMRAKLDPKIRAVAFSQRQLANIADCQTTATS